MPYGSAPSFCYPLTELSVYILLILCIVHSLKQQGKYLIYLFGGLVFGLLLEFVDVYFLKGYTYGRFFIMLGSAPEDIPFWIGVGWGIIIYSSRLFTDKFGLPMLAAAALDALLALNIDFTMDVTAYRLHMWDWGWTSNHLDPLNSQWFGIPYNNYFGWLTVVFTYSYFSRLLTRAFSKSIRDKIWAQACIAVTAIILSEIILFSWFNNIRPWLTAHFGIQSVHLFLILLLLLIVFALAGWKKRNDHVSPASYITWLIPGWFHLYFLAWFFLAGFNRENNWMTFFAILSFIAGLIIHGRYLKKSTNRAIANTA
jgi:hypothetical protein